ncbi:MAG: FkbM family methyltransferase [Acidimicrobiaceae bacterium]|nr:FkbM family methyltransferase [Acidimicrobiaceae bacterium]
MESEQEHLVELFSRVQPECVLDVGANIGQYGTMLRDHGYGGWIVSFEPVQSAFDGLSELAERDGRWRVFRLALGDRAERSRIAVSSASVFSSFKHFAPYADDEFPGVSEVIGSEEVEVRTLNDSWQEFLRGLPQSRIFLKVDTQGSDLEVVKGATSLLPRLVGVQLEAALVPIYEQVPTFPETVQFLGSLGLGLTGMFPVNRDSLLRLIEVNCVFVNPTHSEADRWHRHTWGLLRARLCGDITAVVPPEASFLLIDDCTLGIDQVDGRKAIPFLEHKGDYAGSPADGEQAVAELDRQTARGVHHIALAWPSFWWLEVYPELADELRSRWRRIAENQAVVVFELGATRTGNTLIT